MSDQQMKDPDQHLDQARRLSRLVELRAIASTEDNTPGITEVIYRRVLRLGRIFPCLRTAGASVLT